MAWEDRNGRRYYYAKEWNGGKVRSIYHGTGLLADCAASLVAIRRHEASAARRRIVAERAEIEQLDELVNQAGELVAAVTTAALIRAGYHRHKRQWRKRRER